MEGLDTLLLIRGLERVIIAIGGIIAVILGAFLFRWGVSGEASLKVRRNEGELQLLNAAPGIFFALFGAGVLAWGLANPIDYRLPASAGQDRNNGSTTFGVTYSDLQPQIDALLEDLLRVDAKAPDQQRLQARLEAIRQRARALRRQLQPAD